MVLLPQKITQDVIMLKGMGVHLSSRALPIPEGAEELFRVLGEAEGSLWLFTTFSGGQEDKIEGTKFCYQNDNISENSARKLLMDPIPLGRFHSHSFCFLQKLHEAALR